MLGHMKGYEIKSISKRRANKEDFGSSLSQVVAQDTLKKEVHEALETKGKVYGLFKEKELAAIYIFEKIKTKESEIPYLKLNVNKDNILEFITKGTADEVSEEEVKEAAPVNDKETNVYRFVGKYSQPTDEKVIEDFEKMIKAELKEMILWGEVTAVIWGEDVLVTKKIKTEGKGFVSAIPLGMGFGLAIGIALKNVGLGIALGMLWTMAFGTSFSSGKVVLQKKEEEE